MLETSVDKILFCDKPANAIHTAVLQLTTKAPCFPQYFMSQIGGTQEANRHEGATWISTISFLLDEVSLDSSLPETLIKASNTVWEVVLIQGADLCACLEDQLPCSQIAQPSRRRSNTPPWQALTIPMFSPSFRPALP